jgi:hypothetical protein
LGDNQPGVRALKARRLSDNPVNPLFNVYLSKPLIVTLEDFTEAIEQRIATVPGRQAVLAGAFLRVALESSGALGFAPGHLTPLPSPAPSMPSGVSHKIPVLID